MNKEKAMVPAKDRVNQLRTYLEKSKGQMAMALPKTLGMSPERIFRIVMTAVQQTPKLLDADPTSLLSAVMLAAQLGLEPNDGTGQAYLVPFNKQDKKTKEWITLVQLMPGYRGLVTLARRSGEIATIEARAVHLNDEFDYEYGLVEKLVHKPHLGADPGPLTHVYAVARFKDGNKQFDVMSKQQVDAIRAGSKGADQDPWTIHYEEMAKKTVVRRISKMLPVSKELQRAIVVDDQAAQGLPQTIEEPTFEAIAQQVEDDEPKGAVAKFVEGEKQKTLPPAPERQPGEDDA